MTAILGRLWVGCQYQIVVVNTTTLEIEVGGDLFCKYGSQHENEAHGINQGPVPVNNSRFTA